MNKALAFRLSHPVLILGADSGAINIQRLKFDAIALYDIELNNFNVLKASPTSNELHTVIDVIFEESAGQINNTELGLFNYGEHFVELIISCNQRIFERLLSCSEKKKVIERLEVKLFNKLDNSHQAGRKAKLTECSYSLIEWFVSFDMS
jgi:hypothetical protein